MIDTAAVLKFLARSTPALIEALPEAGISSYPQLAAVATWFLSAAVAGMPELAGDVGELATALQGAYEVSVAAFERTNPGVRQAVADAGSLLVLVPPVPLSDEVAPTVN